MFFTATNHIYARSEIPWTAGTPMLACRFPRWTIHLLPRSRRTWHDSAISSRLEWFGRNRTNHRSGLLYRRPNHARPHGTAMLVSLRSKDYHRRHSIRTSGIPFRKKHVRPFWCSALCFPWTIAVQWQCGLQLGFLFANPVLPMSSINAW